VCEEVKISFQAGGTTTTDYGDFTPSMVRMNGFNILGDPFNPASDMTWGDLSLPRGALFYQEIPAGAFTSPAAVGEVVAKTTGTIQFPPGRAMAIEVSTQIHSAVAQNPIFNVRLSNLAGTILFGGPRIPTLATGQDVPVYRRFVVVNDTGTFITKALALTINPSVATSVVVNFVAEPNQSWVEVTDLGASLASGGVYSGVAIT
jgi:hypothetical protein